MRTLALFPLLLAISPSRIRIRRVTEPFQSSFTSKTLRSISVGMIFPLLRSRTYNQPGHAVPYSTQDEHASELTFKGQRDQENLLSGHPPTHTPHPQRAKLGDGNVVVVA